MAKSKKDREKRAKLVYNSTKKWVDNMDSGYAPTCFKVPEGVELFRFKKEGNHALDIVPFIAGKRNPNCDEGLAHYERTYYVHNNVGPEGKKYCCLARNFGKKCPICEHVAKLKREGKTERDTLRELEPKQRQLWCFQMKDKETGEEGLFLFESSYYRGFGELLADKLKADEEGDYDNFWHLDDGMSLRVYAEEDTYEGRTFYKAKSIEFKPRKEPLSEDLVYDAPCLDELLIELPYDKLKEMFEGEDGSVTDEDDEEEEKPTKKKKPKKKVEEEEEDEAEEEESDDEGDDVDGDSDDEEEEESEVKKGDNVSWKYKGKMMEGVVLKVNEKKGIAEIEVEGKTRPSVVDLDELTVVESDEEEEESDDEFEEEEEEEKPAKKKKPSKKKVEEEEDEDEAEEEEESDDDEDDDTFAEDDEEEEEEEEKPKKKPLKRR